MKNISPNQQDSKDKDGEVCISLKENIEHSSKRKRMLSALQLDAQMQLISPDGQIALFSNTQPLPQIREDIVHANGSDGSFLKNEEHNDEPETGIRAENSNCMDSRRGINGPVNESSHNQQQVGVAISGHDNEDISRKWHVGRDGVKEITIKSYAHYMEVITSIENTYNLVTQDYDMEFAFLGTPVRGYALTSALARLEEYDSVEIAALVEGGLLKNFSRFYKSSAPDVIESACLDNVWAMLSLMHHNGCPTRLMEWTFNPNVALYFACENAQYTQEDGEVWFVKPSVLLEHQNNSFSYALLRANVACPNYMQQQQLIDAFEPAVESSDLVGSLRKYDEITESNGPTMNFFIPPYLDDRMKNQSSLFSVVSNPLVSADEILAQHPGSACRILIPSFLKGVLHDTLDFMGVHERMLFPGLGGLSVALTRYFTRDPRPSPEELEILCRERRKEILDWYNTPIDDEKDYLKTVLEEHAENSEVSLAIADTVDVKHLPAQHEPTVAACSIHASEPSLHGTHGSLVLNEIIDEPNEAAESHLVAEMSPLHGESIEIEEEKPRNTLHSTVAAGIKNMNSDPHVIDEHILLVTDAEADMVIAKAGYEAKRFLDAENRRIAVRQRVEALKSIEETVRDDIDFKDGAHLTSNGAKVCRQLATILEEYPDLVIMIEHHTSCNQTDETNCTNGCKLLNLSQRRAYAVKNMLEKVGCANKLKATGWGCKHPELGSVENLRIYPANIESIESEDVDPIIDNVRQTFVAIASPRLCPSPIAADSLEVDYDPSDCPVEKMPSNGDSVVPHNDVSGHNSLRMMSLAFNSNG